MFVHPGSVRPERGWGNHLDAVEQCRVIVTADSLAVHSAFAVGVPAVVICSETGYIELIDYPGHTYICSDSGCPHAPCGAANWKGNVRKDCPGNCMTVAVEQVYTIVMDEVYHSIKQGLQEG